MLNVSLKWVAAGCLGFALLSSPVLGAAKSAKTKSKPRRSVATDAKAGEPKPVETKVEKREEKKEEQALESELGEEAGKGDARKKKEETIYREPFYKYKINTTLGVNVLKGNSALLVGAQFAYGPDPSAQFYIGPEISFSKFNSASLILVMAGAWYEARIYQTPRLFLAGGMLVGAGFTSDLGLVHRTSLAFFAEGVLGQDINDLFSIRAQLRPGFIDGYFAYMMNLNVQFRFH